MSNRTIRTDESTTKFLKSLARLGNVTKAAQAAKVSRRVVYEWREADPDFAVAWDEALEEASDVLEAEAFRRAVTGTLEPVFYQGEKVGTVRRYSDSLLTLLLKSNRPEKFKERVSNELTGPGGGPVEVTITRTVVKKSA